MPGAGGIFEVVLNDRLLFSKAKMGRFPNAEEVERQLEEILPP